MATLSITPAPSNEVAVSVNSTDVTLSQGTTLNVEVTPTPITTINIDQGIIGPTGATGPQGPAGQGVAVGGTTGQVLYKTSNADYATGWETLGTMSSQNANSVAITGGTATNLTNLQSDYLQLDTAAATAIALAKLRWNVDTATASFGIVDGTDEVNIGQQMFAYVTNAESFAITRGQAVYLYQAQGDRASVKLASNLGDSTSAKTLGLVAQNSIGANQTGFVITQGQLSKVNTSAFTQGDTLYLGATAGTLTNVKPHAPNHLVYISVVERANAGNGQMYVRPQNGYELEEIHDVQINNPVNGQTIIYDASTDLWKNANLTAGTGVTITNGPSSITISAPDNGTVTNVTGTSPISVATGTTTPVISMPAATTSVNGYLTSTDWTTFNSKGSGSVTSVGGTGTVSGISLSGTVTSSGNLTLGGTLDLSSPPAIGNTTPNTGKFTSVTTPSVTATTTDLTLSAISTGVVNLNTLNGTGLRLTELAGGTVNTGFGIFSGTSSQNTVYTVPYGTFANSNMYLASKGNGNLFLGTNSNNSATPTTQAVVSHTASAVNYVQVTGAATGSDPTISAQGSDSDRNLRLSPKGTGQVFSTSSFVAHSTAFNSIRLSGGASTGFATQTQAQGTDTNISMAFQPKGTGAIDLAAGSSGVNISNGGTVTAITRTATGSGYTSIPTIAVLAPTTAGGVQAVVTQASMAVGAVAINNGGTGYTVGNTLTVTGGTGGNCTITVSTVSSGVITGITFATTSPYTVLPTNPVSVTGGSGSSATFNLTYGISGVITITNAGSGYIEQPTITFSGGGGSGAAAYATVGSNTTFRSIGNNLNFNTPSGTGFGVSDAGATSAQWWQAIGGAFTGILRSTGSTQNGLIQTSGTGGISLQTNNGAQTQFIAAHTASAVNYVQVTGAATTGTPVVQAQGSDTNVSLAIRAKGAGNLFFQPNSLNQFAVTQTASAVNYLQATGSAAGSAPAFSVAGSDTNIDLALTSKGTGVIQFGTHTANADTAISGYITIKDSGGTLRKLAVIT
jgi:hypothetical protein